MVKESDLDNQIDEIWKYPIYDGIIDINKYNDASLKILWILKEPNKTRAEEKWYFKDFLKKVTVYKKWKRTYKKIIFTTYGLLNDINTFENIPKVNNDATICNLNVLEQIAYININKNGGKSKSNNKTIENEYEKNKDFIKYQINEINPDIIINASRVLNLFKELCKNSYKKIDKFEYGSFNNKLIFNVYHPNSYYSDSKYYNNIKIAFNKLKNREE